MTAAEVADRFQRLYAAALKTKATNDDFEKIGVFLRSLARPDLVRVCLDRYVLVFPRYQSTSTQTRDDAAFYLVLLRIAQLSKPAELDAWREALTDNMRPFSPLRQRFEDLGRTDRHGRDQILDLVNAPKQARAEAASVLDELRDAFAKGATARASERPSLAELLAFSPLPYEPLEREFRAQLAMLDQAFKQIHENDQDTVAALKDNVSQFWDFVKGQRRDGLRLFQLMRWWRAEFIAHHVPSQADDIGYVLVVAGLLSHAVGRYHTNQRLHGFTHEEWTFVNYPFDRKVSAPLYRATYKSLLGHFFGNVPEFLSQCLTFLRLLAAGSATGASLATDDELRTVTRKLVAASPAELDERWFRIDRSVAALWYTRGDYRLGQQIGTKLVVIYFEGQHPTRIYVEFAHLPVAGVSVRGVSVARASIGGCSVPLLKPCLLDPARASIAPCSVPLLNPCSVGRMPSSSGPLIVDFRGAYRCARMFMPRTSQPALSPSRPTAFITSSAAYDSAGISSASTTPAKPPLTTPGIETITSNSTGMSMSRP